MKTTILQYNTLIKKEGKDYIAYVPTLGISDFGKTVEEAQKNIKEAIVCHIEGLSKTKSEIPAADGTDFFVSQTSIETTKTFKFA